MIPPSRRQLAFLIIFITGFILFVVHYGFSQPSSTSSDVIPPSWFDSFSPDEKPYDAEADWIRVTSGNPNFISGSGRKGMIAALDGADMRVRKRLRRVINVCDAPDPFKLEYGRTNLRLTRGYEGSHHRVREFVKKVLRGERVTIAAIGGSITAGHHVWQNEAWFWKLGEFMDDFFQVEPESIIKVNGAAPAVGSDYFSFCFPLHIPATSDLILVELGVNDAGLPEHVENMENLIRGLLDLPSAPAVILVEAMAFSNGGMGGGGGRMHLPVAQYYDVPFLNHRHPLANHFARFPELVKPYFAQDWWGNPDTRHVNSRGHRDLGNIVASFIRDVTCLYIDEPDFTITPVRVPTERALGPVTEANEKEFEAKVSEVSGGDVQGYLADLEKGWPEQSKSWKLVLAKVDGSEQGVEDETELMPGIWMMPTELGILPRMRVLDGWNPDLSHRVPPFHPICHSTRAKEPAFNLTPIAEETKGWEYWVHPEHLDKPYLVAKEPGSKVSFEIDTSVGLIKLYVLKSRSFGLGKISCWVGHDIDKAVTVDGWWDDDANIGQFATVRDDLSAGRYTVTCRLLSETSDPGGGTEFRIISLMSL